jgi:hypothetical protein
MILDEFRIWNVARTQAEIRQSMCQKLSGNETGLVLYFNFDNTSGTTAYDLSGNDRHGTLKNMENNDWITSGAPLGSISVYDYNEEYTYSLAGGGRALNFDSVNDYVSLGNRNELILGNTFTIEAWIYATPSDGDYYAIIGNQTDINVSESRSPSLWLNSYTKIHYDSYRTDNTRCIIESTETITANQWNHIAVVFDSTTLKLYGNGTEVYSSDSCSGYDLKDIPINYIGKLDNYFQGSIDEVRLWTVARTATQIQDNMNTKLLGNETGLVAYYRFDSTSGTTLYDSTDNHFDGTLMNMDSGSDWVVSGVQLSDANTYAVSSTVDNRAIITAQGYTGTINSIHLYYIKESPNVTTPPYAWSSIDTTHYFGVFTEGTNQTYSLTYDYSSHPDIRHEDSFILAYRANAADSTWKDLSTTLNANANSITKLNISNTTATEFILGINYFPTLVSQGNQTTNEDTAIESITLTATDTETAGCSMGITYTSSLTSLVSIENISYTCSSGVYTFSVTPTANQYGLSVISITITDSGGATSSTSFSLTVVSINDSPDAGYISNQNALKNTAIHAINLTTTDIETAVCTMALTYSSSDTSLFSTENISYTCDTSGFYFSLTPTLNQVGTSTISITLTDEGGLTVTRSFDVSIVDPPSLSTISDQNTAANTINFTIVDAQGGEITITALSSDETVLSYTGINLCESNSHVMTSTFIAGVSQDLTLTLDAMTDAHDKITITIIAANASGLTSSTSFSVIVSPPGSGNALAFDGANDHIALGTINGTDPLALSGSNFTFSLWIKPALSGDVDQKVIDKSNNLWGQNGYCLQVEPDGTLKLQVDGTLSIQYRAKTNSGVLQANQWQHIAMTGDGSNYKAYINGISVTLDTKTYVAPPSVSTDFRIGKYTGLNRAYNGSIDELHIWNRCLSQTEIRQMMCQRLVGNENGLLLYYRFDHNSGTVIKDLSGNGYHGTLTDMDTNVWVTSGAAIGDISVFDYDGSSVSDFSIQLSTSEGDTFTATGDGGTYNGIQLYRVNELPTGIYSSGIYTNDNGYWGAFPVGTTPTYGIEYHYNGNSNIVNSVSLDLLNRSDNSDTTWTGEQSTQNAETQTITQSNISGASIKEFYAQINHIPQLATIADQTTNMNTAILSIPLTATDIETTEGCSLSMSLTSSNTALISTENLSYTCSAGIFYISMTPTHNQIGSATITATVADAGNLTSSCSFDTTVLEVERPQLSDISPQSSTAGTISFTVSHAETGQISVRVISSDSSVISYTGLNLAGSGSYSQVLNLTANEVQNLTLSITPLAGQHDRITLTVIASDANGITSSSDFSVIVSPPGSGNALEFDDDSDYISLGSIDGSHPLALVGTNFSLCFWMKPTLTGDSWQRIIDKSTSSTDHYVVYVHTDYKFRIKADANIVFISEAIIEADQWQHIAITMDGASYLVYHNGRQLTNNATDSFTTPTNATGTVLMGKSTNTADRIYDGILDEFSIWNRVLTVNEIRQNMCQKLIGNENGLLAYYRFDSSQGSTLLDLSGNDYDATLVGKEENDWVTSGAPLGYSSVYDYVGTNPNDFSMSMSYSNGDALTVIGDGGSYSGIYMYLVNESPNTRDSLSTFQSMDISHYYGVFTVGTSTTYSLTYYYGQQSYSDDDDVLLAFRANNADTDWSSLLTVVNTNTKELSCQYISIYEGYPASEFLFGTQTNNLSTNDLVAHYPLNGNLDDTTGNGNSGSLYESADPRCISDRYGSSDSAYLLDGYDDYLRLEDFNIPETFSISTWLYFENNGNSQAFIGKYLQSTYVNIFILGYYNNKLHVEIRDTYYKYGDLPTGYHLITAVVEKIDSSNSFVTVYLNQRIQFQTTIGAVLGSDITGYKWTAGMEWDRIDSLHTRTDYMKGNFDEISFFNRALNANEIRYLYNVTPIFSSVYHPTSVSDVVTLTLTTAEATQLTVTARSSDQSIISDSQINLNSSGTNQMVINTSAQTPMNLTVTVTPESRIYGRVLITCSVIGSTGITETTNYPVIVTPPGAGMALDFDGSNDYIDLGEYTGSDPIGLTTSIFTMSFWIKPDISGDSYQRIIDKSVDGLDHYTLYLHSNALLTFKANVTNVASVNDALEAGVWQHVAFMSDGISYTCYINGSSANMSNSAVILPTNAAGTISIGRSLNTSDRLLNGQLDEFQIWNRVLTQSEVRQNMCQKISPYENGLMLYYRFDQQSGTTVTDLTGHGYRGTLTNMSDSNWVTSGAAIGDVSIYDYVGTNPNDFSVSLSHSNGDRLTAIGDGGNYSGIHMYVVNESPNNTTLPASFQTMDTSHYFGVFPVGRSTTYSMTYYYGNNTYTNENEVLMAFRENGADTDWDSLLTILDTQRKELSCPYVSIHEGYPASEFIFGTEAINLMTNDLVAYYPFNTNANDETGNGNNGDIFGARLVADRNGFSDSAYRLDGTDDWIRLQDFNVPETFSVSMWLDIQNTTDNQCLVGKTDTSESNYLFMGLFNGGKYHVDIRSTSFNYGASTPGYHLITFVVEKIDASNSLVTVFVDQSIKWQQIINETLGSSITGNKWSLGQDWDSGPTKSDFFKGILDEVSFYNRALNANEIRYLYNLQPMLSPIESPTYVSDTVNLTITTVESTQVTITAHSSDQTIIPDSQIILGGSGSNQLSITTIASTPIAITLTMTKVPSMYGRVIITCSVIGTNGLTETRNFPVIISPSGSGMALEFDGTNNYVDLDSISGSDPLALTGGEFTLSFWVKPTLSGNSIQRIIDKSNDTYGQGGYGLTIQTTGKLQLYTNNNTRLETLEGAIKANIWQHISVTSDGTTYTCYINGYAVPVTFPNAYSAPPATTTDARIGNAVVTSSRYFQGQLDELSIWNRALSINDIRQNMCQRLSGNENGLLAYYRFDHTVGTTLSDLSGNGYHGVLTNMSDSNWVTSGAALGDVSIYDYSGSTAPDFIVNLSHADGDSFSATGDSGTYSGIHLYLVNEAPNVTTKPGSFVEMDTTHYYGVFPVGENVTYSITYDYENNDISDQNLDQLAFRANNADMDWSPLMTVRNNDLKTIRCENISYTEGYLAGEFIYGTELFNLSTSDVIAHYPFNGNIDDESGNGNDGDLLNGGMSSTTDRYGNANSAYQFDGSDDFITLTEFHIPETCTVSFWFNIQSDSQNQCIVGKHTSDDSNIFTLGYYGTPRVFEVDINTDCYGYGGIVLGYHHATAVIEKVSGSSSKVTVYMDGKILWQHTINNALGSDISGSRWVLGQDWDSGGSKTDFFDGTLDDVTFYNRALNASEVRYLYENITDLLPQINPEIGMESNLQTDQNTAIQSIPLTSTFSESLDCNIDLTFTSSNTTLIAVNNISYTCDSGTFYLSLTPTTSQLGSATISITASDTWGITALTAFDLTVNAFNNPPEIGFIADQTTNKNVALTSLPLTATDIETAGCSLNITFASSNTSLVSVANMSYTCDSGTFYISLTPTTDQLGTGTISITVTDSGYLTAGTAFALTVLDDNTAPVIGMISDQTINEDSTISALSFTATDAQTTDCSLSLTFVSSNTGLIAVNNISYTCQSGTFYLSLTPTGNQSGTASITITVTDEGSLTASTAFDLTVNAVNDTPEIGTISDQTTYRNIALTSLSLTATDIETAGCSLNITFASSNTSLISVSNMSYTCDSEIFYISLTPTTNQLGTGTISITVTDSGSLAAGTSFALTVLDDNTAPVIGTISDQTINEDSTISALSFTATDAQTTDCSLSLTFVSSNTGLIAVNNISYTCQSGTFYLLLTPTGNQSGNASITITVTDEGSLTASTAFGLTVIAVNTAPAIGLIDNQTTNKNISISSISLTATDNETADCNLNITFVSSNTNLISTSNISYTCDSGNFTLSLTPSTSQSGLSTITVTINDPEGLTAVTSFDLTVLNQSPVAGSGHYVTLDGTNDYIAIGNESFFDFTTAMTVELWMKVDSFTTAYQAVIAKGDNSWRIGRNGSSNTLSFSINSGSENVNANGSINVNDGNWHHVAGVLRSGTIYLYIDGQLDASTATSYDIVDSSYSLFIGANEQEAGRNFNGSIDEVRIWRVGLTQSQIEANMNEKLMGNESGLIAYWRFDDSQGLIAQDSTSNYNHGTLTNMDNSDWIESDDSSKTVNEDASFTMTAGYDPDGDSLTITTLSGPSNGTLSFDHANVVITYTPTADYSGADQFTYQLSDGTDSVSCTVSLTVTEINDQPIIGSISDQATPINTTISSIQLTASDETANCSLDIAFTSSNTTLIPVNNITSTCDSNGFDIDIAPANSQTGNSTITVTITDADGLTSSTSFNVMVSTAPIISSVSDQNNAAGIISYQVTDNEGGVMTVTATSSNQTVIPNSGIKLTGSTSNTTTFNATASTSENLTLAITPNANQHNRVTITITVTDAAGLNDSTTFTVIVSPPGSGYALSFDGTNEYINLGTINSSHPLALAGSNFTFSLWIKPTLSGDLDQKIINKNDGYYGKNGYSLQVEPSGLLGLQIDGTILKPYIAKTATGALVANQWQHIAMTGNGSSYKCYINGVSVSLTVEDYQAPPSANAELWIGKYTGSNKAYNGSLDEVRIWNRALSQTEIQQNMCKKLKGNESGLILYYRFDHSSGSTIKDLSGNGYDGNLTNMENGDWDVSIFMNWSSTVLNCG